jgi:hypothetical protein
VALLLGVFNIVAVICTTITTWNSCLGLSVWWAVVMLVRRRIINRSANRALNVLGVLKAANIMNDLAKLEVTFGNFMLVRTHANGSYVQG